MITFHTFISPFYYQKMKTLFFLFAVLLINAIGLSQTFVEVSNELGAGFTYAGGEYGGGVSFVDFNQDGLDDLTFASGLGASIRFYQNNGNGYDELAPFIANTTEVKQVLWVDIDNDHDLDLYITSHVLNRLYRNDGELSFTDITSTCGFADPLNEQSFCATWFDYDNDGLPDLCVSFRLAYLVGYIKLYHNIGSGQFEDVTIDAGFSGLGNSVLCMSSLDVNQDGFTDLYIGQDWDAGCLLMLNNGDGTFSNLSNYSGTNLYNNSMTTTIGDWDNDGFMDIYVTDTDFNSLLENNGDSTFMDVALEKGVANFWFTWGAVFLDADNDMDLDLHVNSTNGAFMYENLGEELGFTNVASSWGFANDFDYSVGIAIGDFNNDGRADIAKNNASLSYSSLYRNDITGNNFLSVDLVGTVSNSMAIGAVIDVYAGGLHQYRRVACGEGFSSQNSYTQFFGLGSISSVDEISIHWPSGITTVMNDIPANQRISVVESLIGAGCTDLIACNYESSATEDDGSCVYPQLYYDCTMNCINDIDLDGVCDELEVLGCVDSTACDYNYLATEQSICTYSIQYYSCEGECLLDDDLDGICNELEIFGCTDPTACNYDIAATQDNQSCSFIQNYEIDGPIDNMEYSGIYTYPNTEGSTYEWIVDSWSFIESGQGTSQVTVFFNNDGQNLVSVIETNAAGCVSDTISIWVFTHDLVVEKQKVDVFLFPNPLNEFSRILNVVASENVLSYEILSETGSVVLHAKPNSSKLDLNLFEVSSGVYFIKLNFRSDVVTQMFTKE